VRFDPQVLASLAGLQLRARHVMEGFVSGVHGSPFHGLSVEFSEYRDYQPGDEPRHIDWRLYARNDRLCVKRFEQETNARCYVLCDTSASMAYRGRRAWGSKIECARVVSTALAWLLLRQNDAVGGMSLDEDDDREDGDAGDDGHGRLRYLPPSRKPAQFGTVLGHFEALAPAGGPRLAALLARATRLLHRRSLVFFVSDLLEPSEDVASAFRRLQFDGHEVIVIQVLDPDEIDFPFAETTLLEDLETGERRQARPGARHGYLARFRAFMEAYRDLFRDLEIPHLVLRTDQHPGPALARFVESRKRRP
jgi:uncharacterized protein (DUF58 family)